MCRKNKYAVAIKDKTPINEDSGRFLFMINFGTILPIVDEHLDDHHIRVITTISDENGKALLKRVSVAKEAIAPKPLKLTGKNLAKVANELTNEPYGWGGLYQNRDCSAMLRDMFAPFGILLPRHSADQAKEGGVFIDLTDKSLDEKEKTIITYGIPYLTLLWKKGHIMLYIGQNQGKPLLFHNIWDVRTKNIYGAQGRHIIGKAVITTLDPGVELCNSELKEGEFLKKYHWYDYIG